MLASPFEAEDAVQETLLRAWRSYDRFEGRAALRSWLYRIATNVCLDMLNGRERRARPMDLGPAREPELAHLHTLPEATWIQPIPDSLIAPEGDPADVAVARETIRLAFVAALQHLPARQRAVLILREVLRWPAADVAELLDTSVASVNSALQRARGALEARMPASRERAPLPRSARERELLAQFAEAFERGDVDGVVALLTDDALVTMPPEPMEYQGPAAIAMFLRDRFNQRRDARPLRLVATRANDQPAFGHYMPDPNAPVCRFSGVIVLTLEGDKISALTRFGDTGILPAFGLPRILRD
jgi:RNA polymerase sigma-70 factor (ECF subfamily)